MYFNKEYKVVTALDKWEFEQEVNAHLEDGWELYGSPSGSDVGGGSVFAEFDNPRVRGFTQALLRNKDYEFLKEINNDDLF